MSNGIIIARRWYKFCGFLLSTLYLHSKLYAIEIYVSAGDLVNVNIKIKNQRLRALVLFRDKVTLKSCLGRLLTLTFNIKYDVILTSSFHIFAIGDSN